MIRSNWTGVPASSIAVHGVPSETITVAVALLIAAVLLLYVLTIAVLALHDPTASPSSSSTRDYFTPAAEHNISYIQTEVPGQQQASSSEEREREESPSTAARTTRVDWHDGQCELFM